MYFTAIVVGGTIYKEWPLTIAIFGCSAATWDWLRAHTCIYVGFLSNWSLAFNGIRGHVDPSPPHFRILWSICVEEQFYLFFPILIFIGFDKPKFQLWIVGLVLMASILFRVWFATLIPSPNEIVSAGGMYYASLSYGEVFLAGAIAGSMCAATSEFDSQTSWWAGLTWLLSFLVLGHIWNGCLWYPYSCLSVVIYGAIGISPAGLIRWVSASANRQWMAWLSWRPLTSLGKISYGIYIWHIISNTILAWFCRHLFPRPPVGDLWITLHLFLTVGSAIAFGAVSYFLIEAPFLRLKTKYSDMNSPVRQSASSDSH